MGVERWVGLFYCSIKKEPRALVFCFHCLLPQKLRPFLILNYH